MNIRRYEPGEEEELWQLYHGTTHEIIGQYYTPDQIARWAPSQMDVVKWKDRIESRNPFVAERDGAILGFAELEPDGHIDYFYCHHQWQRKGVGTALYRALETEARRQGVTVLYAEVSVPARPFFLSMGFEIVEEQVNLVCGAPAKRFVMRKRLSDNKAIDPIS
jgi:GNAT superfamily N-acetyltransferase